MFGVHFGPGIASPAIMWTEKMPHNHFCSSTEFWWNVVAKINVSLELEIHLSSRDTLGNDHLGVWKKKNFPDFRFTWLVERYACSVIRRCGAIASRLPVMKSGRGALLDRKSVKSLQFVWKRSIWCQSRDVWSTFWPGYRISSNHVDRVNACQALFHEHQNW